jgi:hypothetical protein
MCVGSEKQPKQTNEHSSFMGAQGTHHIIHTHTSIFVVSVLHQQKFTRRSTSFHFISSTKPNDNQTTNNPPSLLPEKGRVQQPIPQGIHVPAPCRRRQQPVGVGHILQECPARARVGVQVRAGALVGGLLWSQCQCVVRVCCWFWEMVVVVVGGSVKKQGAIRQAAEMGAKGARRHRLFSSTPHHATPHCTYTHTHTHNPRHTHLPTHPPA